MLLDWKSIKRGSLIRRMAVRVAGFSVLGAVTLAESARQTPAATGEGREDLDNQLQLAAHSWGTDTRQQLSLDG
jgi:hypothetical protein